LPSCDTLMRCSTQARIWRRCCRPSSGHPDAQAHLGGKLVIRVTRDPRALQGHRSRPATCSAPAGRVSSLLKRSGATAAGHTSHRLLRVPPIRLLPLPESHMQAMRREPNANREDTQVENLCYEKKQRRACTVVDQPRSSQRFEAKPRTDEVPLVKRMLQLERSKPRYGYRRIGWLLREEGGRAGLSRVFRLWQREGLKVPVKKRKKRRLGSSANGCHRRRAQAPNDVWCWDFVFDRR